MLRKLVAELLGTFWLVLGGTGSAVLAANFMPDTNLGIGLVGVSLAFGLTVLTGAYALGHISGGHFNPAVTIGIYAAGKAEAKTVVPYIVAQVVGGILGSLTVAFIALGITDFESIRDGGLAANGFADWSPGGFAFGAVLLAEVVLTAVFLVVILGSTRAGSPVGFAPIPIGLALTLIHLISIPVSNTSVNPARSTGPAVVAGGAPLEQLWLFWLAPIVGAVLAGLLHKYVLADDSRVAQA